MASNSKNIAELLNGDTTITASDLSYPLTGFSSTGIDDNADATALTITSDENVLIGTTDINPYDNTTGSGIALRSSGAIYNAINNGTPLNLNRMGSDGTIAQFRKGGSAVGSIAANGGSIIVGSGNTGLYFDDGSDRLIPVNPATASGRDNAVNLGGGSERFKDLYLSGGAYLGGTTSAHKLDDYEEGTWSPTLSFGGGTTGIVYGTQSAKYTKIGNVVNFSFRMYLTNKGSSTGHARVNGLPFTIGGMPTGGVFTLLPARGRIGASSRPMFVYIYNGDSSMLIYRCDWDNSINAAASDAHFSNNSEVELVGQYTTNS